MAFLFIWQFLLSGPLEVASGLIAMGDFARAVHPTVEEFDKKHTSELELGQWTVDGKKETFKASVGPVRLGCLAVGVLLIFLLCRRVHILGHLTVTFWLGVVAVIAWILIEGALNFDPNIAFDRSGIEIDAPADFWLNLGKVMLLAMYSYLGYYNV